MTSSYGSQGFAAKYSNLGQFESVLTLGSSNAIGRRILVDKNNYTLISGYFSSPYVFNDTTFTNIVGQNVFLVKY